MDQFAKPSDMRAWSREQRKAGRTIGFVPTMGALHEGHASLLRAARSECDVVVASIFLNPTQFDDPGDLESYPQSLAEDLAICRQAEVAAVFTPDREGMFREGHSTFIEVVGPLSDKLCAMARPGHFRGVATVVAKLFNIVEPDRAFFGQKDLQQALIISRMAADLDSGVEITVCPTIRARDGLALSSRNRRLNDEMREKARALPRGLEKANRLFSSGETDSNQLLEVVATELLVYPGVDVDYVHVIKLSSFEEVDEAGPGCVLAAAAIIDGVRLIDHVLLGGPPLPIDLEAD